MNRPDIFLLCFGVGTLWALVTLLLGGLHLGHHGAGHAHAGHTHVHAGHTHMHAGHQSSFGWIGSMLNPSSVAVFLAWFGGVGYLLTRHAGLAFWVDMALALAVGCMGAWFLAAFLRFLQSREQPLDAADYDMVGVLGQVSAIIRADGVGEVIFVRDGARNPLAARSADGTEIRRGEEVIVTRYEKGIAYVRTWEAMTQPGAEGCRPEILQKETKHVE